MRAPVKDIGLPSTPAAAPRGADSQPTDTVDALHDLVLRSLDDDQAVDVVSIPLVGKTSIADHMVIASGRSTRQVASMAQKIVERIKGELRRETKVEGLATADWVLIDAGDVIVHLFRPEVRTFYNLEKMWAFGADAAPAASSTAGGSAAPPNPSDAPDPRYPDGAAPAGL